MWILFKLFRWFATALAVWWLGGIVFEDGATFDALLFGLTVYGQFVVWPLALLWGLPWLLRCRNSKKRGQSLF